jgi:hypothetical protein
VSARNPFREVVMVARGGTPTHAHFRSRLVSLFVASLALDAVGSVLALLFERHAKGTMITDLGEAAFWTTTQLLTVSSSLTNPLTAAGRVLDVVLQVYAITAVAYLAGSFGAFFHRRSEERDRASAPAP